MISAREALQRLRDGNRRYCTGRAEAAGRDTREKRLELAGGQAPFAVVLGCADSRVPVETVFDQGLGELFVVRVAGNVVAGTQLGSIEFAADHFGSRLVVVLGHSGCGAVKATLEHLRQPGGELTPGLRSLVKRVQPTVEALLDAGAGDDPAALVRQAVRENVRASARLLREGSALLGGLVRDDGLRVVGAEYSLESGEVDFFDGAAELAGG